MTNTSLVQRRLQHVPAHRYGEVGQLFCSFLDMATTATGRATTYNTKADQEKATAEIHDELFRVDRGLYALLALMPGSLDLHKQNAVINLLSNPYRSPAFLTASEEKAVLNRLVAELPTQRMLKLFVALAEKRINNRRTKRLILETIWNDTSLEWLSVKYGDKIRTALAHAVGVRKMGIVRSILSKPRPDWTMKEQNILFDCIGNYVDDSRLIMATDDLVECAAFLFQAEDMNYTLPLLRAYFDARTDLSKGDKLPPEVLEGIRSTFHPDTDAAAVLSLTNQSGSMTQRQAVRSQATAKRASERTGETVTVSFDPKRLGQIELYVYAYQEGMTEEIAQALDAKAETAANKLMLRYVKVGIVIDASWSMAGHTTQKWRPISIALAVRDTLIKCAGVSVLSGANGAAPPMGQHHIGSLMPIGGDTSLAMSLLEVVRQGPEAVFILSDGYENAPAGRVDEVIKGLRKIGNTTPIYQVGPVFAAESYATRSLSAEVPMLSVGNDVVTMNNNLVRELLLTDFERGIAAVLAAVLPGQIEQQDESMSFLSAIPA